MIRNCASEKNLKCFKETVFCVFDRYAPIKKKSVREAPLTKDPHNAIMKRPRLKNTFLTTKSINDRKNYNNQRNYSNKLLRSTKKLYSNNLDIRKINGNRSSWKTVVPHFLKHNSKSEKINQDKCFRQC